MENKQFLTTQDVMETPDASLSYPLSNFLGLTYSFHFISSLNGRKAKGKCRHNLYFASQEQHTVSRYVGVNSFLEIFVSANIFYR